MLMVHHRVPSHWHWLPLFLSTPGPWRCELPHLIGLFTGNLSFCMGIGLHFSCGSGWGSMTHGAHLSWCPHRARNFTSGSVSIKHKTAGATRYNTSIIQPLLKKTSLQAEERKLQNFYFFVDSLKLTPRGQLKRSSHALCPARHTVPVSARTQSCSSFRDLAAWVCAVLMLTYCGSTGSEAYFYSSSSVPVLGLQYPFSLLLSIPPAALATSF